MTIYLHDEGNQGTDVYKQHRGMNSQTVVASTDTYIYAALTRRITKC
jgi:hypothetical protein